MQLIKCPDCNSALEYGNIKCENCGFPIHKIVKSTSVITQIRSNIISKDWLKYHVFISLGLSFLLGFIEGKFNANISVISIVLYWYAILCIFVVSNGYQNKHLSLGWLRLHIVFSIIGGGFLCVLQILFSMSLGNTPNEEGFISWLWWPIFYWLAVIIILSIIKFNKGIFNHMKISNFVNANIFLSIILIYWIMSNSDDVRHPEIAVFFGELFFIILSLSVFSYIWIKNGFQKVIG